MSGNRWDKAKIYGLSPWEALFVAIVDQAIIDTDNPNPAVRENARVWLATDALSWVGHAGISDVEFKRGLVASGILTEQEIDFYRERIQI